MKLQRSARKLVDKQEAESFRRKLQGGRWTVHLLFVVLILATLILTSKYVRYVVTEVFIPVTSLAVDEGVTVLAGAPVVAFGTAGLSLSALDPVGVKSLGWSASPSAGSVALRVHGSVEAVGVSLGGGLRMQHRSLCGRSGTEGVHPRRFWWL